MAEYLVDVVDKAHVEHLVGLVENDRVDMFKIHLTALDEVKQAARRGHDDVHAAAQGAYLHLDAAAAIHGQDIESVDILGIVGEVAARLQAQLARGIENDSLRAGAGSVDALQRGQAECRGLASARLGQAHYVAVLVEQVWNYFFLNGHWRLIP